jgi:hypothetical protein
VRTLTELTRPNSSSKLVAFAGLVETISANCEVVAEPLRIATFDIRIMSSSCREKKVANQCAPAATTALPQHVPAKTEGMQRAKLAWWAGGGWWDG